MKIILASGSPRRKQILADAGFDVEIMRIDVEENYPEDMPVSEVPEYLANKKMQEAVKHCRSDDIIITADTVVILDEQIIGKPADAEDAKSILRKLSGAMHTVISGVSIHREGTITSFSNYTKVYMQDLNEQEIDLYISRYKPFDKAGAYAIQEWIGINKIDKIEGSYYNVVGFPMSTVYKILMS